MFDQAQPDMLDSARHAGKVDSSIDIIGISRRSQSLQASLICGRTYEDRTASAAARCMVDHILASAPEYNQGGD
ncbi:MAG TPA: hypothetical protein VGM98_20695, partial [Schlesneria sp.]